MSPLSAANTRVALADTGLNPVRSQRGQLVTVTINFAQGLSWELNAVNASGSLRGALRDCFGTAYNSRAIQNSAGLRGVFNMVFPGVSQAADYGALVSPADWVTNKNFKDDDAGWTDVAGGVMARSTAQTLIGPASGLLTMLAANDGAYFLSSSTVLLKQASHRMSFWYRTSNAAGTFRGYIEERNAADDAQVGKSNGGTLTPTTSWQWATVARTCTAGNRLRLGFEQVGATACDVHVAGVSGAAVATYSIIQMTPGLSSGSGGEVVTLLMKFDGVTWDPVAFYDALNAHFGTVATDKDSLAYENLELTIAS